MIAVAVLLVLHPVLAEDGPLRLAATGIDDATVVWRLDGVEVARTVDREAAVVTATAGAHELTASAPAAGRWTAVARLDGAATGAAFVPAWSATHEAVDGPAEARGADAPGWWGRLPSLPLVLGGAALLVAAWPRRSGLEALRRLRRR